MQNSEIEKKVLNIYMNNIEYLKKYHKELFDKIELFGEALRMGEIKEKYILEYKENYFDVYDVVENKFLYNTNSSEYSKQVVSSVNFDATKNSFKTFYDFRYEEEVFSMAKNAHISENSIIGNAPIIHYVNKNLPKEENLKTIYNYIVFGVYLGMHIPHIVNKINAKVYHIVEPSLELFRLSLFVTDYSNLFGQSYVYFYVSDEKEEFKEKFERIYYKTFFYNHYIKFFILTQNCNIYIECIQNMLVSQIHNIYSYERLILSLSRTYRYLKERFNYINISKVNNSDYMEKKPVLMLAAGPSLKNNIDFIKNNKDKFIIVSIYSLLPFLEKNNILPDIVTQYDESDIEIMHTIKSINNIDFFRDTIFLFASHLDPKVMKTFVKSNIFVFQAMFESKKGFGILTSPSIGEITYALICILGFRNIYLLGLDMALDPDTNQTHYTEDYIGSWDTDQTEILENSYTLSKSSIKVKGNFAPEVNTLPIYKISIDHINFFTKKFKYLNLKVYNLSNGAYFDDIQPLQTKNIDIKNFKEIDKKDLYKEFKSLIDSISENFFNEEDINYIEEKLGDAKKIKFKLEKFKVAKNSNIESFKNSLHLFHEELCKNYACKDLQNILGNYFNNNIHYIFYLLNLENLSNQKKHIKGLQRLFYTQLNKIIEEYEEIIFLNEENQV